MCQNSELSVSHLLFIFSSSSQKRRTFEPCAAKRLKSGSEGKPFGASPLQTWGGAKKLMREGGLEGGIDEGECGGGES